MGINRQIFTLICYIKKELMLKVTLIVMLSAAHIIQAVAMAQTINFLFYQDDMNQMIMYIGIAFASVMVSSGITYILEIYNVKIASNMKTKIRETLFEKIVNLGPGYIMDQRSGRLQSILMDAVENLEPYFLGFLPQIAAVSIVGTALGIVSLYLDPVVGMIMIVTMILCVIIPYITFPMVRRSYVGYWKEYAFMNAQYIDAIQGVSTLKAFNSSKDKGKELEKNAQKFYNTQLHNTFFSVIDSGIMMFLTSVIAYVTLGIAAYRTGMGLISSTTVPVFLFLTSESAKPMMELNKAWHSSMLGMSAAGSVLELLEEESNIKFSKNPVCVGLEEKTAKIELSHVTFQYPKGKQPALADVNMKIQKGQTVAIVGMSGSGKSTLANLLYRFYDIQGGEIRINGTDIREYDLDYLRRHLSIVFQENYLMSGSIADNIRISNPNASLEEIKTVADAAGAREFIEAFEESYETIVGERGIRLSGGQKQRIAIARALMKQTPIRIFDEATSNVDAISEKKIKESIDKLSGTATTIVIAHRLSTVRNADYIYVMDQGHVAEEGTHEELLAKKGHYYRLIQAQLGGMA